MKSVQLYPAFVLQWWCPDCKQLNIHKGRQRLEEGEEEFRDAATRELTEHTGLEADQFCAIAMPFQVWCCACGEEFKPEPPEIQEPDGHPGF